MRSLKPTSMKKPSLGVSQFSAWSLQGVVNVRSKAPGSIRVPDNTPLRGELETYKVFVCCGDSMSVCMFCGGLKSKGTQSAAVSGFVRLNTDRGLA
jgi:hypothetical protein